MWPIKKQKFIKKTRLIIYRKDGGVLQKGIGVNSNHANWNRFKHWFFGRPQSKYFVFKGIEGEVLILRELIGGWRVDTIEVSEKE